MNTKLVRVDVESLQDEAKKSQSLQILKEAGEIIKTGGFSNRDCIRVRRRRSES